jgi:hypothetical protein
VIKEKHRARKKEEEIKHATHLEDRLLLLKVAHTATTSSGMSQTDRQDEITRYHDYFSCISAVPYQMWEQFLVAGRTA